MKNYFLKSFTFLGALTYYLFAFVMRVPVMLLLFVTMPIWLLFIAPFKGDVDQAPKWMINLYDWYKGE